MRRRLIITELDRFRALNTRARSLLISTIAFGMASPLLGLFTNAFIWRLNKDITSIALYNGMWMMGISISFVVNGWFLSKAKLSWLYAAGLVMQSASCLLLFKLEAAGIRAVCTLGIISGLAAGVYWANRNLLSLQVTNGPTRDYFCGLESALGTILSVLSPLVCGWFLQVGLKTTADGIVERYQLLAVVTFGIQLLGAWYIIRARFDDHLPKSIFVRHASELWNRTRIFTAVKGVAEGSALFIPTLIVLQLVGEEGAVGLTQSMATVLTSVALYVIAARMQRKHRHRVLQLGVYCMVGGALILSFSYSQVGALAYLFLQTLAVQLLWVTANPIILDIINVDQDDPAEHYRYIVDRELCLNLGRVVGVCIVLTLSIFSADSLTLRIAPLILALVTSSLLACSRGLMAQGR